VPDCVLLRERLFPSSCSADELAPSAWETSVAVDRPVGTDVVAAVGDLDAVTGLTCEDGPEIVGDDDATLRFLSTEHIAAP